MKLKSTSTLSESSVRHFHELPPLPRSSGRSISLPVRWCRDRDLEEFVARFGENISPVSFLLKQISTASIQFDTVLGYALDHFLNLFHPMYTVDSKTLSAEEKIEWMQELIATRLLNVSYRARLEENLAECQIMDRERRRILRCYLRDPIEPWLFPFCELADGLVATAMEFEESLVCENCHFGQPLVYNGEY